MVSLYEEVRTTLSANAFRPRKRLGQNFLIHERVFDSIMALLDLSRGDEVVEIGPGLGFLTRRLVASAAQVWAVEIDPFLTDRLARSALGAEPSLQLLRGDILKLPLNEMLPRRRVKLAANLPYSISTPILFRLLDWREHFSTLVLMVQKEVADRIAAQAGTKSYGTLSLWCQVHGRVAAKVMVSREAFYPRPKVRSTILKIEMYPEPLLPLDELPMFRCLVRAAFSARRKTLGNALASLFDDDRSHVEAFLHSGNIDPKRRGETLSVDEFIGLARLLKQRERAVQN